MTTELRTGFGVNNSREKNTPFVYGKSRPNKFSLLLVNNNAQENSLILVHITKYCTQNCSNRHDADTQKRRKPNRQRHGSLNIKKICTRESTYTRSYLVSVCLFLFSWHFLFLVRREKINEAHLGKWHKDSSANPEENRKELCSRIYFFVQNFLIYFKQWGVLFLQEEGDTQTFFSGSFVAKKLLHRTKITELKWVARTVSCYCVIINRQRVISLDEVEEWKKLLQGKFPLP